MKLLQVTIGGSATVVSATSLYVKQVVFQNNGATNAEFIGDSTVATTKGIQLLKSGGSLTLGPYGIGHPTLDLATFFVAGTNADKLDVMYIEA